MTRQIVREAFDRESEKEHARRLLEQRRLSAGKLSDPKILRRAVALLQRRGYSSEVIFHLLRHCEEED